MVQGLQTARNKQYNIFNDILQRYDKIKDSANNFSSLLLGLTTFAYKPYDKSYITKLYVFYLFSDPSKLLGLEEDYYFQYLQQRFAEHNFHFNKVFYEGIQFISKKEEEVYRQKFTNEQNNQPLIQLTKEEQQFINEIIQLIDEFTDNNSLEEFNLQQKIVFKDQFYISNLNLSNQLYKCYITYITRQGDSLKLKKSLSENKESFISLLNQILIQWILKLQQKNHQKQQIGCKKVIDFLIDSKKPIVVHNSMLDIVHLYPKFIDKFNEYQKNLSSYFTKIYNTKLLSEIDLLKNVIVENSLGDIFNTMNLNPFKQHRPQIEIPYFL